jgi:peptidoglycan-associated lipoprotein
MRSKTLVTMAAVVLTLSAGACASRRAGPVPGTGADAGATDPMAGQPGAPGSGGLAGPGGVGSQGLPGADGIAGAPVPGSQAEFVISAGERVYFDTDSYSLRDDALPVLAAQAQWLQRYPNVRVIIEGNADERGTREYNLGLGARRAAAVAQRLVENGVSAARISTVSYGKERPIDGGSDESAWQRNRNARTNFQGG